MYAVDACIAIHIRQRNILSDLRYMPGLFFVPYTTNDIRQTQESVSEPGYTGATNESSLTPHQLNCHGCNLTVQPCLVQDTSVTVDHSQPLRCRQATFARGGTNRRRCRVAGHRPRHHDSTARQQRRGRTSLDCGLAASTFEKKKPTDLSQITIRSNAVGPSLPVTLVNCCS